MPCCIGKWAEENLIIKNRPGRISIDNCFLSSTINALTYMRYMTQFVFALVWLRLNDLFRITFFRCFKPLFPGYYYGKLQCLAPGHNMAKIWVTPGSLAPESGIRPKSVCNLIPFILFCLLNGEMGG